MRREFDFRLEAGRFFPLFMALFIPWVIVEMLVVMLSRRIETVTESAVTSVLLWPLVVLAVFLLTVLLYIPILRRLIRAVSLDGEAFAFEGSIGRFTGLNLLGLFLTVITLGIYGPWYLTRVCRYLAGEVSYKERALHFTGKGGRLFVIILLTIVLPMIPLVVVQARLDPSAFGAHAYLNPFQSFMLQLLVQLVFWSVFAAYVYSVYRWFFTNLRYGLRSVFWTTQFWPSVSTIWIQIFVSAVTLGVYLPAAYIKLYRYFVGRTVVGNESGPAVRLGFRGRTGKGFGLLWGQLLLTVITLGFYTPWAIAKAGRWFLSNTYVEPS